MTRRQKRMVGVALLVAGLGVAAALTLTAFRKNLMNFYTPTDLVGGSLPAGTAFRLGGLVERGSLKHGEGLRIQFIVADCTNRLPVRYDGLLPDLFREGQGVVATGALASDGTFEASEILAKHDENYVPPTVAGALKTAGGHSCAPFKSVTAQ